MLLFETEGLIV